MAYFGFGLLNFNGGKSIPPIWFGLAFLRIRVPRKDTVTKILMWVASLVWRLVSKVPVVSSRALYMLGLAKVGCDSFKPAPTRGSTALPHYAASQGQKHDWT